MCPVFIHLSVLLQVSLTAIDIQAPAMHVYWILGKGQVAIPRTPDPVGAPARQAPASRHEH